MPTQYAHAIESSSLLDVDGSFGRFADDLLALELPELPDSRRADTVGFVCRRANQLPTPLRLGVIAISVAVGCAQRWWGRPATTAFLHRSQAPFVGELARMVRSLGVAYVWETWPNSSSLGRPA